MNPSTRIGKKKIENAPKTEIFQTAVQSQDFGKKRVFVSVWRAKIDKYRDFLNSFGLSSTRKRLKTENFESDDVITLDKLPRGSIFDCLQWNCV